MGTLPKYNQITYNLVAKVIREEFPTDGGIFDDSQSQRHALCMVALNFADRFKKDNPEFEPYDWLDRCSPDTDLYPLSELWDERP
jgi:hypothetical protein